MDLIVSRLAGFVLHGAGAVGGVQLLAAEGEPGRVPGARGPPVRGQRGRQRPHPEGGRRVGRLRGRRRLRARALPLPPGQHGEGLHPLPAGAQARARPREGKEHVQGEPEADQYCV